MTPKFSVDGTVLHWPDGSTGKVRQEDFKRDIVGRTDSFIAYLTIVDRPDSRDLHGELWLTSEDLHDLPGGDVLEQSGTVREALAERVSKQGLDDRFVLNVRVKHGIGAGGRQVEILPR